MRTKRKQAAWRITEEAKGLLVELSRRRGHSQAAVLEAEIRTAAEREGIRVSLSEGSPHHADVGR